MCLIVVVSCRGVRQVISSSYSFSAFLRRILYGIFRIQSAVFQSSLESFESSSRTSVRNSLATSSPSFGRTLLTVFVISSASLAHCIACPRDSVALVSRIAFMMAIFLYASDGIGGMAHDISRNAEFLAS